MSIRSRRCRIRIRTAYARHRQSRNSPLAEHRADHQLGVPGDSHRPVPAVEPDYPEGNRARPGCSRPPMRATRARASVGQYLAQPSSASLLKEIGADAQVLVPNPFFRGDHGPDLGALAYYRGAPPVVLPLSAVHHDYQRSSIAGELDLSFDAGAVQKRFARGFTASTSTRPARPSPTPLAPVSPIPTICARNGRWRYGM